MARHSGLGAGRGGACSCSACRPAVANLDVRYDAARLDRAHGLVAAGRPVRAIAGACRDAGRRRVAAPWRADLAALEQQLRAELARRLRSPRGFRRGRCR